MATTLCRAKDQSRRTLNAGCFQDSLPSQDPKIPTSEPKISRYSKTPPDSILQPKTMPQQAKEGVSPGIEPGTTRNWLRVFKKSRS
ncbi:hypothetical protein M438DRAFT_208495 [Aureobasidium pullulans EXF-150]|uniref:Uncharacterized protein n=1 Tax=Aureobasidium pullulans EXF-150 TaxID=1043002 RepID=A0A074XI26_AURPU|nr:uncharacterized protein M438DRAFT_208495 [Aureobasidium pullulans EXF-150]KEQ85148.1 hypothetical protein M438DRAFT_208495 [Aureobasidium pullulans EXF-150]